MYSDPTKIRSHVVKLRFSDEEYRLIDALTAYTGEQRAALLRDLVMDQATSILEPQSTTGSLHDEGPLNAANGYS